MSTEDITLKHFESLIEKAYQVKKEKSYAEALVDEANTRLSDLQTQLLAHMEEHELDSYKSKWGTIVRVQKMSVKTPKDPESKAAFFAYLDSKGIKDDILTINSRTLNAMYNSEIEAARERGDAEFSIPGIETPTVFASLTMRK